VEWNNLPKRRNLKKRAKNLGTLEELETRLFLGLESPWNEKRRERLSDLLNFENAKLRKPLE